MVHRDLKPSNIRIDNYGTVLVLDFGIARARDIALKTRTAVGERLGTPLYMSPEQVRGATADGRSDLYSLGILMYEMATGSNPFDAESPHAVYLKQINEVPPPVSRVNSAISRKLSRILLRLLEKEPEKRFQSALEVLTAFESAGLARKITTPPPSKIQESDEREGVLRKRPPTVSEEAFSADHKKILEHVNGSRSASDVLRLTSLDSKRFQRALNDLVRREAVSVLESNKKSPAAAAGPAAAEPVGERFSQGFGRSAIAMVAAILILLSVFAARDVPVVVEPVALTVDASPYAAVNIVDASNRTVFRDETPFVAALPPGDYSLQFTYDSRQVTRSVALVDATPGEVRHEFWEGVDVEDLLTQILDQ